MKRLQRRLAAGSRARARHVRAWARAGSLVCLAAAAACATAVTPEVAPPAPAYADFAYPRPPAAQSDARLEAQHRRAWEAFQGGDVRGATAQYSSLVKRAPGYLAAEVGLGFVLLSQQRLKEAVAWFDHAIRIDPRYAPAHAGRAEAYLAGDQRELALAAFETALKLDPTLPDLGRRVELTRFAGVRQWVTSARRAADDGRLEDARRDYLQAVRASPDSAVLYRDLAAVELRLTAVGEAVQHLRQSVALDGGDARALVLLGDALERQGDVEGALEAYRRASGLDNSETTRRTVDRLRERVAALRLPAEYQALPRAAQLTRGDVAAMLGIRLQALLASAGTTGAAVVATDVRGHWASPWIMAVTRARVMDVYANHTFQPDALVRRVDMAQIVARVLAISASSPGRSLVRVSIADLPPDHLSYPDVAIAVSSGVMGLVDGGMFRPSRGLSGPEAADVVDRLERLTRKSRTSAGGGVR